MFFLSEKVMKIFTIPLLWIFNDLTKKNQIKLIKPTFNQLLFLMGLWELVIYFLAISLLKVSKIKLWFNSFFRKYYFLMKNTEELIFWFF